MRAITKKNPSPSRHKQISTADLLKFLEGFETLPKKYVVGGKVEVEGDPPKGPGIPPVMPPDTILLDEVLITQEEDPTMKNRFPEATNKYYNAVEAAMDKESGRIREKQEGGYYKSASRINEVFPRLKEQGYTDRGIRQLKRNPEALFNAVYGGEYGEKNLGNTERGDGYMYRGRGPIQLTGKANYAKASEDLFGDDRLVRNPSLVTQPEYAEQVSTWFLKRNKDSTLNRLVDTYGYDINREDMSQEDNNLLVASQVSGGKDPHSYQVGREGLRKMNRYTKRLEE